MTTALDVCSLAWGDREGYVCLSVRDPKLTKEDSDYWVDHIFEWPNDKRKIATTLIKAKDSEKDVYWAPGVFSVPHREAKSILPTNVLWSDLDEANPRKLPEDIKPSAAWETSEGRFHALWTLPKDLPPDQQQSLNRRLTRAIGADAGGWDAIQVLRIPGTINHKYQNQRVKLLWFNGHKVDPIRIATLPEPSPNQPKNGQLPDPKWVYQKYKRKLPLVAKELIRARHAPRGQRSDKLWYLIRLLSEAGMKSEEAVSVASQTVWNKFRGRRDEFDRLFAEATKARARIKQGVVDGESDRPEVEAEEVDEDSEDFDLQDPVSWGQFDKTRRPVRWLVADVWGESQVGFVSGHPKSYKSWLALDLAVSVSTGRPFLGAFDCKRANVLLVQEEDPRPVLQDRLATIGAAKDLISIEEISKTKMAMYYSLPENLYIISNGGFTITSDEWMELIEKWIIDHDIGLLILDPLMMMAENVDEFKSFELMTRVLKPLKKLRNKTQTAICIVHHHTKADDTGKRPGAAMYGGVGFWAWEESSIHLQVAGIGKIVAERFTKHALLKPITITIGDIEERGWKPQVEYGIVDLDLFQMLQTIEGGATISELETATGLGRDAVQRKLKELIKSGRVVRAKGKRRGDKGRPSATFRVVPVPEVQEDSTDVEEGKSGEE